MMIGLVFGFMFIMSFAYSAEWNPSKPIKIIVPWGAGGVTIH